MGYFFTVNMYKNKVQQIKCIKRIRNTKYLLINTLRYFKL